MKEEDKKKLDKELESKSKLLSGVLGTTGAALYGASKFNEIKHPELLKHPETKGGKYILAGKKWGKALTGAAVATGSYAAYKHYKNKKKQ